MKVTVRGWNRDMGEKLVASHYLPAMEMNETGAISRDKPAMYRASGYLRIAWFRSLALTGNYRMEICLSRDDILRLFRSEFRGVLSSFLIEEEGFTMSEEFLKAALRTVKLTDLTVGDLVAMSTEAATDTTTTTLGETKQPQDATGNSSNI